MDLHSYSSWSSPHSPHSPPPLLQILLILTLLPDQMKYIGVLMMKEYSLPKLIRSQDSFLLSWRRKKNALYNALRLPLASWFIRRSIHMLCCYMAEWQMAWIILGVSYTDEEIIAIVLKSELRKIKIGINSARAGIFVSTTGSVQF